MSNQQSANRLVETLQELALSSVKEDNKAIARLESRYGQSITGIINEIENNAIIQQSIKENAPKVSKSFIVLRQLLVGLFVSSMVGLISLFIKPEITRPVMILGFVAGLCERAIYKEDQ